MTVYRVSINLFFDSLADIQAFKTQVQAVFPKVRNVVLEKSNVILHVCHHDEIPPKPCEQPPLYSWEKT